MSFIFISCSSRAPEGVASTVGPLPVDAAAARLPILQRSLRCKCIAMADCRHIVSSRPPAATGEIGCAFLRMAPRKFCLWSSDKMTCFSFGPMTVCRQRLGLGFPLPTAYRVSALRPGDHAGHAAQLELLGCPVGGDEIHVAHGRGPARVFLSDGPRGTARRGCPRNSARVLRFPRLRWCRRCRRICAASRS